MFRALWIKQWVQLRTLRWVGFGLNLVMPLFLWTGAAAAKRGWFPFHVDEYSLTTLFGEALPAFSVLLWGLLAVMFAAQTFAGDRADQTERFLLERPVPRARAWLARVLASLLSALVIALSITVYLFAIARFVDDGSVADLYSNLGIFCSVGLGVAVLGTLGGMAAGEMVRTPMQAVLAGLVLAALPLAVATFLASVFELVRISDELHLAFVVAPILPGALILASYRSGCLGEPSGRGRIKRGLVVLVAGLLLTPALFAALTPFVLRATVTGGWAQGTARTADRAVIIGWGFRNGGWMIDTRAKRRVRFLPPPLRSAVWNADGSMLATIHQAGPLGSIGRPVLEWFDPAGSSLGTLALETEPDSYARGVHWAGDKMLVPEWAGARKGRIRVIDPVRGETGVIDLVGGRGQAWRLLGPTDDGSIYLHRLTRQDPRVYELSRLDLETPRLEPAVLTEDGDLPTYALRFLSPTGRYWARVIFADQFYTSYVIDLHSGERVDFPGSLIAGWLSGDRLVRLEGLGDGTRVVVQRAAGEEILSRAFTGPVGAKVSPDAQRFLVTRFDLDRLLPYWYFVSLRTTGLQQLFVCDGRDWTELSSLVEDIQGDDAWVSWGGPGSLIASNGVATAVADAQPGAAWEPVLGRWP